MIVKRKGAQQKFTYNVCNTFALKEIVDLESSLTSNNTCYKVGNKSMPIPSTINYCMCEKTKFFCECSRSIVSWFDSYYYRLYDLQKNVKKRRNSLCEHLESFS